MKLLTKNRKNKTISSSKYRHANWMRFLAAVGGAVSLVFHFIAIFVYLIPAWNGIGIILAILGMIVDFILLGSLNLINHKFVIEMTWLSLLVLGILDGIFFQYSSTGGWGLLGTLLIIIAAFIGIYDRL